MAEHFGSTFISSTIVNFTIRFIDIMYLNKIYIALPNLKRLAMFPFIHGQRNLTSLYSHNCRPPTSLKYLHLRLICVHLLPFEYMELLFKTFPPTQLEYISIFEDKPTKAYDDIESWFSILTMSTLKLKQLHIKLYSEETNALLIQRLRQHFGNETEVIELKNDPHIVG